MFNWFRTASNRALADRIDLLERALARAVGDLEDLTAQHRKLRGRFYAERGAPADEQPQKESKAQILARIGYVPGRPAPHKG